ncbi:hypothetical protein [Pendulispora albinea]|uniref:Uncharacterized protein n=1 Tax=Pendulispora albinea TaxID=2741071 RepID=A0ABZ2LXU7_9BACT
MNRMTFMALRAPRPTRAHAPFARVFLVFVSVFFAVFFVLPFSSIPAIARVAHADPMVRVDTNGCFPACRSGYVCSPHGQCVSRCNPPCGAGEKCLANGECTLASPATSTASPARANDGTPAADPSASSPAPAAQQPRDEESFARAGLHIGPLFQSSNSSSASGFLSAFQVQLGGQHAAVLGARAGVVFYEKTTTPEVGLDLGYRARFGKADGVRGGPLFLVQPQLWFGNTTGIHVGGALGGFIEYKQLVIQIPVGAGAARSFEQYGPSSKWTGVFTFAPTVGIQF